METVMAEKYYVVDSYLGGATPVERVEWRCAAVCKGWRAFGFVGDIPVQCTRQKGHGKDGEYCRQHARKQDSASAEPKS
jgi:hypothetical protein